MTMIMEKTSSPCRLSVLVIILESRHLHSPSDEVDVHEEHPVLKERLSPGDKCWKTEEFAILEPCDLCTSNTVFAIWRICNSAWATAHEGFLSPFYFIHKLHRVAWQSPCLFIEMGWRASSRKQIARLRLTSPRFLHVWNQLCSTLARVVVSDEEILEQKPLVCIAKAKKELVECKESGKTTYRR